MLPTITAIIVDDEFRARKTLLSLITEFVEGVEVIAEAESVDKAVPLICEHRPDLVFLDVNMPSREGFSLLEDFVLPDFEVIFTTAHEEYAIRAFRLNAMDYLVKPIDPDELQAAIDRFREARAGAEAPAEMPAEGRPEALADFNKVVLPTQDGFTLTDLDNVLRCEAAGSYTVFHLRDGRQIVVTRSLKGFEEQFHPHFFQRIHHKDLVNLRHVTEVNSKENYLLLSDGAKVWISTRKKPALLKRLKGV